MRVALFASCLVDQCWPSAGAGALAVLRRLGCEVSFDPRATCCGQPAYNAGHRGPARLQAQQWIASFERSGAEYAVLPSGSCTAMGHQFPRLFAAGDPWRARAEHFAECAHELCGFLVSVLAVDDVGASFHGTITWHDACHGLRELGLREEPRHLLKKVRGARFVELADADACCGFGGTFAVKHPELSVAIVDKKVEAIAASGVDAVVASDASCLMQIEGRLRRVGSPVRVVHVAELLGGTLADGARTSG
ncbi:MAG: (Fe-S)-binding protein [Planctomycetes bacterium]|nr:(Fe-S)-binding protein [Planctomycetota bacterium]